MLKIRRFRPAVALLFVAFGLVLVNGTTTAQTPTLPDLAMLQPTEFRIELRSGGVRWLRFSTSIVNLGPGRFDAYGSDPDPVGPDEAHPSDPAPAAGHGLGRATDRSDHVLRRRWAQPLARLRASGLESRFPGDAEQHHRDGREDRLLLLGQRQPLQRAPLLHRQRGVPRAGRMARCRWACPSPGATSTRGASPSSTSTSPPAPRQLLPDHHGRSPGRVHRGQHRQQQRPDPHQPPVFDGRCPRSGLRHGHDSSEHADGTRCHPARPRRRPRLERQHRHRCKLQGLPQLDCGRDPDGQCPPRYGSHQRDELLLLGDGAGQLRQRVAAIQPGLRHARSSSARRARRGPRPEHEGQGQERQVGGLRDSDHPRRRRDPGRRRHGERQLERRLESQRIGRHRERRVGDPRDGSDLGRHERHVHGDRRRRLGPDLQRGGQQRSGRGQLGYGDRHSRP